MYWYVEVDQFLQSEGVPPGGDQTIDNEVNSEANTYLGSDANF